MVWEQSCELIIMLTEVVENGKVNNVCFWYSPKYVTEYFKSGLNIFISSFHFATLFSIISPHQVRCCQYWPDKGSTKDYGKFEVMTQLEQVDRVYITRRFKLRNNQVSYDSVWIIICCIIQTCLYLTALQRYNEAFVFSSAPCEFPTSGRYLHEYDQKSRYKCQHAIYS